jgi:ribosomal protein L11 methyltransferase
MTANLAAMFVWSKLSSKKWADAWEERFAGDPRAVITGMAGRSTIRIELYCERKREALDVQKSFGGTVREVKARNWAALTPVPPPPVKVRDRLIIVSEKGREGLAALRKANPARDVISIPPDMAFGTGHHATTATVLRMLVDFAQTQEGKPWTMLDIGTGSGVLAIAAEKLGAARSWGCDFDPLAVKVARDNLGRNGVKRVVIDEADALKWTPREKWDCVAANLFHDVLEAIFPKLARSMKRGGILLISGILRTQAESCLAAGRKAGLEFDSVVRRGKWVTARGHLR